LLLPAMRELAFGLQRAALLVSGDESARWPPRTRIGRIIVELRLPAEVLPVVRVVAVGFVVLLVLGAPLSFEMELVVVGVLVHEVEQRGLHLVDRVRERTEFTVLASGEVVGELGAELRLVALDVIKALYLVVCKRTA